MSQLTQHAGMYLGSQRPEERQKRYVSALVHILDGQSDQILQTLDNSMDSYDTSDDRQAVVSLFWDDEHKYTLKSGGHFDFKTTYNNSDPIQGRNRVVIPSEGGDFFHEFIIDETKKRRDVKEVYSSPSELDLKKMGVIEPGDLEDFTVPQAANYALSGTEWALGIVETSEVGRIGIKEYTNPYTLLKRIATTFNLEIRFRVEIRGNKIVGRYVDYLQKRGAWRGKEITLGKDLIGVERSENTKDVVTALKVVGPVNRDEAGNESQNVIEVKDEEARQRWSRTGAHLWDIVKYENEDNPEYYTKTRLRQWGEENLDNRTKALVEYATDTVSLEDVFGLDHEVVRIGDTVRVKDASYKPALYMEARIFEIKRSLTNSTKKTYKLGDYVEYTADDIESLERRMLAKISRKIGVDTLERYAERKRHEGPEPPEDTSKVWIDTSRSPHVVKTFNVTSLDWERATPIYASEVNAYDRSEVDQRIQNAENAMNTAAENYARQYSETYYEDNITSAVQEAKTYTDEEISSTTSTLQGAIDTKANENDVNNALSGKVSITSYSDDYNGLDGRISNNTTGIGQNEQEISLQAQELTQMGNDLSSAETEISALADEVEIRATTTEVNAINGRLSEAEATISAQANEIDLKVNVDDIISRINLSEEAVLIAGNRVEITGETFIDDAVITNAMIDSLHGKKILAETITSTALAVQYLSAISGDLGVVNTGELNAVDIFASRIEGSEFVSSNGTENLEILSGRIRSTDELIIEAPNGLRFYGANIIKMANGTSIDNDQGTPRLRRNEEDYIAIADREADIYLFGDRKFRFYTETAQPDTHTLIANGKTKMKALNRSTRAVQFRNDNDTGYVEIMGAEFTIGSSEKTKENFEHLGLKVMNQILQTPIYTYTRKPADAEEITPVKVGTKFEEMPVRLRREGETIDIYGMVAYSWKGLQELHERIQILEEALGGHQHVA